MAAIKQNRDYYIDLINYIGKKLNTEVIIIGKENYNELNSLLKGGEVDAAFIGSGPYIDGHDAFGLEPLVMPQVAGQAAYQVYIIVPANSPAKDLKDLRGKVFGFSEPESNMGKFVLEYLLAGMKERPETFFTKYVYTHGQEVSVKAVADNKIDGASVSSYVWEYINKKDPGLASRTRVIWKSESYASPPFVVRPGLFPELKNKLESILLGADIDPEGSRILRCLIIEKFVPARDEAFDKIRAIKAGLINSGGE